MKTFTGAQIITTLLERQGVRVLAGIPGGANLPMYDALSQSRVIRHVLARHEQGAGFIAQGMARATGETAVCYATSGPGATNILTAIADAKLDSIPIVCITGQVPQALIGTDAFQEVDTYGMSIPITKHNFLVRSTRELLAVIPEAFRLAASGRPGPVLIDVPKDVQSATLEIEEWPEPGDGAEPDPIDVAAIERAAEMISRANSPILYVGGGVVQSGAAARVRAMAEANGIPVTMTLMGLGTVPSDHALSLGMLGMHGAPFTNIALEECDLLIAVGVRFDDRATGKVSEFCPNAKVVHLDIDPSEIHKIRRAHVGITGDCGAALALLAPRVKRGDTAPWLARIRLLKETRPMHMPGAGDPRTPYGLIRAVAEIAGPDAVVTTDVGQHQMWAAQTYPLSRTRAWLTSGGLGTMGFGLPAAIGAALARPEATVVCFSGDGSLQMNIQELATAAEENVNVKIVLMNNNSLGLVHQQQDLFYGKRIYAADYRRQVDFLKIAEGFGVRGYELAGAADPRRVLEEAFKSRGPALIHAPIDVREKVFPMVPPGAANRDMIGGEHVAARS